MKIQVILASALLLSAYGVEVALYALAGYTVLVSILFYVFILLSMFGLTKFSFNETEPDLLNMFSQLVISGGIVYMLYTLTNPLLVGFILPWIIVRSVFLIVNELVQNGILTIEEIEEEED